MSAVRRALGVAIALCALPGCQTAPVLGPQAGASLTVSAQVARQLQTLVTTYTAASINHTVFQLDLVDANQVETLAASTTIAGDPSGKALAFNALLASTHYRLHATAYDSTDDSHAISDATGSEVDVTTIQGPSTISVPVVLLHTPFDATAGGGTAVTAGVYTQPMPEAVAASRPVVLLAGSPTGVAGDVADTLTDNGVTAGFDLPEGVTADSGSNVYVADTGSSTIWLVTASGNSTLFAGSTSGFQEDTSSNLGVTAQFAKPTGVSVDGAGGLLVVDADDNDVRRIDLTTHNTTTLSGWRGAPGLRAGFVNDVTNDSGASARFNSPQGIAADAAGHVYVADTGNNCIREIDLATGQTHTVAGSGTGSAGASDDALSDHGVSARFNSPQGIAVDAAGSIYVADTGNNRIRKIDPTTGTTTTLAGSPTGLAGTGDDFKNDHGVTALFNGPRGIAVDVLGNVYVTDAIGQALREVSPNGNTLTVEGSRTGASGLANDVSDDQGATALFDQPLGLAVDAIGTLYIADTGNSGIRRVH